MSLLGGDSPFSGDDGAADPAAASALAAFAAGRGSEHAALTALAASRLLVPVVAAETGGGAGQGPGAGQGSGSGQGPGAGQQSLPGRTRPGPGGERGADMSLPTLVGRDGRAAIPAFTSLDTLTRWRPAARPVPAQARLVWRAAADGACAVVVDVAGPVPLAVDGAALAALAAGQPVPHPHEDPDVLAAVRAAAAGEPGITGVSLAPGDSAGCDLQVRVTLAPGHPAEGEQAAKLLGARLMTQLGGRLRRGIAIAVTPVAAP